MTRRPRPELPPPVPAPNDLACWLHAAYGPEIPVAEAAVDLHVAPSTLRRWIASQRPPVRHAQRVYLARRAILRGRGTYLWPQMPPELLERRRLQALAQADLAAAVDQGEREERWLEAGYLERYLVTAWWYPHAHAWAISAGRTEGAHARHQSRAEQVDAIEAPTKFHAMAIKQATLEAYTDHRCVTPRELLPTGHTEAFLSSCPPPSIVPTWRTP